MTHRYSLRFETGERTGELVPITGAVFTVGRKQGNSLQLSESSVSGRHAELSIDETGVLLRDVGSTNGTKVGGLKVVEARVPAGATIHFGNVGFLLHDAEAAADPAARGVVEPESTRVVSEENLRRSRRGKGSKLGLVALLLIAAGGAGAWWWLDQGAGGRQPRDRAVEPVAGNLLADGYSFESRAAWEPVEAFPVVFQASARSRYSGQRGLGADLGPGESAEHRSPEVRVNRGGGLVARARVRVSGDVRARIGLHFLPEPETDSTPGATTYWSAPLAQDSGWVEVEVGAASPGGYDRVQVVVRASAPPGTGDDGGGRVDVDDVSLVPGAGGSKGRVDQFEVFLDRGTLTLFKVDRVLLSGMHVRPAGAAFPARVEATLAIEANGARLDLAEDGILFVRAERPLLVGGLATLGEAGYTPREGEFEADGVTDLLLGRDQDLVRLAFGGAVKLRGRRVGSGLEFQAALPATSSPMIQLDFVEERRRATGLASNARDAQEAGDRGLALGLWQQLLDEVPFDAARVDQAQGARARLLQTGFEETSSLAEEIERARFFRLIDLYRQCRDRAADISARYAGSEVDRNAQELIASIDADLSSLEAELDRHEVTRLRAILAGLRAQEANELAAEVERYLLEQYGEVQ